MSDIFLNQDDEDILHDNDPSFKVLNELRRKGVSEDRLRVFETLLLECSLTTVGAMRMFPPASLHELIKEMFDTSSAMGKMRAEGFAAAVQVNATNQS